MSENRRTFVDGIKLTAFVAFTSVITGILAVTIANHRFGPSTDYKALFSDSSGLLKGDEVRVAGVRIGQINDIKLYKGTLAEVHFSIEKTGPFVGGVPSSTLAQVRYRNLIGQRYLSLTEGPGTSGVKLPRNGTIPVEQTEPALDLTALFNGFRPLFQALNPEDVNKLSFEIVKVLQGEGGTINSLLTHVASLTNTLADRDAVIGRVITNLSEVLGTISDRTDQTNALLKELQGFVSGVADDRKAIFDSLSSLNSLTGVTADLLAKARPSIQTDIEGLNALTRTLADNDDTLDKTFKNMRDRLEKLNRTTSYGSWFNYYLCSMDARIVLPGAPAYFTPKIVNDNARCKQ
ncbi:MCE family protein [Actinocorallia longicatena]|uniref:MlaD family protein n=1 Tax=Actinocorallia longicatena TaxID=111803 RepID=A0ABP6QET0_9ACTN